MKRAIFVTGGHVTPAIAVIEEIQKRKLPWQIFFIGRKKAMEGSQNASVEYQEMTSRGIPFLSLVTGRVSRVLTPWAIWSLAKIPIGFFQALYFILRYRPHLVVCFGGYVAFPVAVAARLCGVSVVTHEQTRAMGLVNRIISLFATQIFLSFPNKLSPKTVVTGLPLRQQLFHPPEKPSFKISKNRPMLYITGGSTGAVTLNETIFSEIETLTSDWIVVHQTGEPSWSKAVQLRNRLSTKMKGNYIIAPYFSASDVAWILHHAKIVIGRSGANTVGELSALGKVSILIPLPWSGANEQQENARWLKSQGTAIVVPQEEDAGKQIIAAINVLTVHRKTYQNAAQTLQQSIPKDASSSVVDILEKTIAS